MDNIKNFRDIGGIRLNNDRFIKQGLFFRSANLDQATDNDIAALQNKGIKEIFDFRESELINLDIYKKFNVNYNNYPIMFDSARICNLQKNKTLKTALIQLESEDMRIAYRNLPFNNLSYKQLFNCIREEKIPVLFHCNVGKDRTGVASAILLLLLGADRDSIIKDYLLTEDIVPYIIKIMTKDINFLVRKKIANCMMPLFQVEVSYINSALDEIINRYNTYDNYFLNEYGINKEEIERLRNLYTQ